ncbi:N-acetyl-gamma-glutamyl-phosphate reductase [Rickettsiales bacterium]|jgi:N-acetyl-gamma-glutamyl-phosphate reductase|nr:N-acetyl-gamma-glutamyl-phosphate reductase [Rickettsiales bacterium]
MKKVKVAIIGCTGYTGLELIKTLSNHQYIEISALVANENAGKYISEISPSLLSLQLPIISTFDKINLTENDIAFLCLPHNTAHKLVEKIIRKNSNIKIIDLSADYRINDQDLYNQYYNTTHSSFSLQKDFTYGLSEIYKNSIKKSNYISCPGCYPTSILLPLIPLLKNNLIKNNNIIIDSKSGYSGAGKSINSKSLFCEVSNSFKAYNISTHKHIIEIEQELSKFALNKISVEFTPHIIPINRGILSTIYCDISDKYSYNDINNCLVTSYNDSFFVNYVSEPPEIKDVTNTNFCNFTAKKGRTNGKLIIISVIDNLLKGASGQAVQNLNLIYNFDERTALTQLANLA